jgi:ATP-dependent DNA helicase RecG
MLSFGKYPQQFYPQFVIRAADLRGVDDGTRARNVTTIDGAIPRMLTATMDWLRTNISTSLVTHADGSVRDVAEYPLAALRELVANALVHRDLESWSEGMAIEIRLQSDRLVITNPGGLYGITVDRLGLEHVTSARNQRLVSLCVDSRDPKDGTRVIEALSTGLTQVAQLLRAAALPPAQFFDSGVSFTVVLHQSQNLKNLAEAKDHRLAVRPDFRDGSQIKLIYETLKSDGPGTVADIAARTSIPASSVRRTLTRLRDDYGVVELQGGRGQNSTWLLRLSH